MLEDLSSVWLSHCMKIAHPGELSESALNVVGAETHLCVKPLRSRVVAAAELRLS